jgi:galactose mutarotase-like enzyme
MAEANKTGAWGEKILLRAGDCSVTILPRLGGKIASILVNGHELLQAPLAAYAPRTQTMAFDASDASGWDECLPSVAGCSVETADGPVAVPDHGDLWRVAWAEQGAGHQEHGTGVARGGSVTLRGECFSLPLMLERTLLLTEKGKGWRLNLDYTVTNTGGSTVPWAWSAHSLFAAEAGDRIVLPDSIHQLRLEGGVGDRLGKRDDRVAWPIAKLGKLGKTDLSVVEASNSGNGDKLFAGPLSAEENWCSLERPKSGIRIKVGFDTAATPYLGLWICSGGWPERKGPKQNCVAMEPATAPVDSLAITGPWSRKLDSGQSDFWPMTVDFQPI